MENNNLRRVSWTKTPGYTPTMRQTALPRVRMKKEMNVHTLVARKKNGSKVDIIKPSFCEECHSGASSIVEKKVNGNPVWHCNACGHEW